MPYIKKDLQSRQNETLSDASKAGFFDYATMLADIRNLEEVTASVKVLIDVLELAKSTDTDFIKDFIDDIRTMLWIAERETKGR